MRVLQAMAGAPRGGAEAFFERDSTLHPANKALGEFEPKQGF